MRGGGHVASTGCLLAVMGAANRQRQKQERKILFIFLYIEFEEEDVAVLDDVLLAFGAEQALLFYRLLAAVGEEVVRGVAVGFDEALFEVGVDDSGGSWVFGAADDGPCADLLHSGGVVDDQVEQAIGGVDEAVEAGLFEAHVLEELV